MIREWVYCRHGNWVPKGTKRPRECAECRREYDRAKYARDTGTKSSCECPHCGQVIPSTNIGRPRKPTPSYDEIVRPAEEPKPEPSPEPHMNPHLNNSRCEDCGKRGRATSRGVLCHGCWSDEDEARNRHAA